jgi:hypothetical protein
MSKAGHERDRVVGHHRPRRSKSPSSWRKRVLDVGWAFEAVALQSVGDLHVSLGAPRRHLCVLNRDDKRRTRRASAVNAGRTIGHDRVTDECLTIRSGVHIAGSVNGNPVNPC